eukprot:1202635-Lingulodinium_polyedra.AAC.1
MGSTHSVDIVMAIHWRAAGAALTSGFYLREEAVLRSLRLELVVAPAAGKGCLLELAPATTGWAEGLAAEGWGR